VHGVVGADQRVDVSAGEELRRGVRTFGDRDLQRRPMFGCSSIAARAGRTLNGSGSDPAVSTSPSAQRPPAVTAERAKREWAVLPRYSVPQAAGHQHIAAHPDP
jgi:hypothetical protein